MKIDQLIRYFRLKLQKKKISPLPLFANRPMSVELLHSNRPTFNGFSVSRSYHQFINFNIGTIILGNHCPELIHFFVIYFFFKNNISNRIIKPANRFISVLLSFRLLFSPAGVAIKLQQ